MRLLSLMLLLSTEVCSGQTPTPSPNRYVIKLTEPTETRPVLAYVGGHRFKTVEQLKTFISGLPRGSQVHFNWYGQNFGRTTQKSDFYKAGRELREFAQTHDIVWTSQPAPYW